MTDVPDGCAHAEVDGLEWEAPTVPVIGDADSVRIEHAAEMRRLVPRAEPALCRPPRTGR
ncbi:hypothetical protein ABT383_29120 [Streptomyces humidus]|uniref:hypothetical protein n=1 Tax=Streptomyces humidus TaxID=52259 RepID=UPI00167DA4A4|nr:hypothetical protein [Streptomyces humidus]